MGKLRRLTLYVDKSKNLPLFLILFRFLLSPLKEKGNVFASVDLFVSLSVNSLCQKSFGWILTKSLLIKGRTD